MSWESDFWKWFRRRGRFPLFGDRFFDEMDRMMEDMLREAAGLAPRDLIRERRMPDGSTVREIGPIVYGYSMKVGPDGRPVIREFGNVKPAQRPGLRGIPEAKLEVVGKREPLVDIMEEADAIKIIAELPGVEKSDIKLNCDSRSLTISVDTPERKYYKDLELPAEVDPNSSKASYKNGVLEVSVTKMRPRARGRELRVE